MPQVVIENPVINSPFEEPARHFRFDEQGITNTIVAERRISQYFVPIAKPRKTAKERQLTFDESTEDRIEENKTVNAIRRLIQLWREGRYTDDVTRTTARLLECWQRDDRSRRLFFCQIEALKRLSTSPKSPRGTAVLGSRTTCAASTKTPTPACCGSPPRWPPAAARPSSSPC
ncbi:MAG: hypothetical protein KJ000_00975 [Pirellulaceae bacterium]|nr:hypothetical protein [Pirellulaceae bacterium]